MTTTDEAATAVAEPEVVEDDLGLGAQRRRATLWTLGLLALLLASVTASVGAGAVPIPPADTARIVAHHLLGIGEQTWSVPRDAIVWDVRMPRALLAIGVGAGLSVCGAALQAMVRNVLADPYLLGVNSGASSGAAAAILFGAGAGAGAHALPLSAFIGALASWGAPLVIVAVVVALTVLVLVGLGRRLDALAIGDETAQTLGVRPDAFRVRLLLLVALCVGVVVSASGSIGFVGLVIPHLARRVVGSAHRHMLPVTALMGAIFLIWADIVARTVLTPQEIPLGILTSLVGAPFLLVLIRRMHVSST